MTKYMVIVSVLGGNEKAEFYDYYDEAKHAFRAYAFMTSVTHVELYAYIDIIGYRCMRSV